MVYYIDENERKKTQSTCYIEFQRGKYNGKFWNDDSLYMKNEVFDDLKMGKLFSSALEQFDYYGITEVTSEAFNEIRAAAEGFMTETREAVMELEAWLGTLADGPVVFTVIGM